MTLFDTGASHSFVAERIWNQISGSKGYLKEPLLVRLPDGKEIPTVQKIDGSILISGHEFVTELICVPLAEFDIILGMDWLCHHVGSKTKAKSLRTSIEH